MQDLWIFISALVIAYLVPGPDMVLILQTSAIRGRANALAVAAGLGFARASHVFLAAIGLATLLRTAPAAFEIIRYVGAIYLMWIGVGLLRAHSLLPGPAATPSADKNQSWVISLRRGLLTNLLNPKSLLFCSVLLPQFIQSEHAAPGQFLLLGSILVAVGLVFDLMYAVAGAMLARWIAHSTLAQHLQRWIFGTLLIGFGLRLFLSPRPA